MENRMTKMESKIKAYKIALQYIDREPTRSNLIIQIDNMEKALKNAKPVKKVVRK